MPPFARLGWPRAIVPSKRPTTAAESARALARRLRRLANQVGGRDPIFAKHAMLRLDRLSNEVEDLLDDQLTFTHTETWRTVYQEVLSACRQKRYLSAALVEHEDYWQDLPGQASLEFNYDLVAHGFFVHRRFILSDFFWPQRAVRPAAEVYRWILDQASHGIEVSLVRWSQVEAEATLLRDFGIYGERAVGYQTLDDQARTAAYVLRFGASAIEGALELWRQLDLYAIPLDDLLDRPT